LGLLFVMIGLGVTGWFLFTQIDTTPAFANRNAPNNNQKFGPNPKGAPAKPNARLVLPAQPDPVTISPAPVTAETTYKLPEPAGALRVGGGGRFLVMHFPTARRFGVFDTNEAKIVRFIPAPDGAPFFAAGMRKLLVYAADDKVLTRYDLTTGQREASRKIDVPDGKVEAFALGHASAGPLLIGVRDRGASLYDIDSFGELDLPSEGLQGNGRLEGGRYWAGASGRVFGRTGLEGQPSGIGVVGLEPTKIARAYQHEGTRFVVPGPDDRFVYVLGHGILTDRATAVNDAPFTLGPNGGHVQHLYLPAAHGPFFMHASIWDHGSGTAKVSAGTIRVFLQGSKVPFATFTNSPVRQTAFDSMREFGLENAFHLIPQAKLLVVVPEERDQLHLYPADLDKLLAADGRDYLYVNAVPTTRFEKGRTLAFSIDARAKNGPVRYRLESGPAGMTVTPTGLLRWPVPGNYAEARAEAILVLTDRKGNEKFHTIVLDAK
jgi:hypothetical protein